MFQRWLTTTFSAHFPKARSARRKGSPRFEVLESRQLLAVTLVGGIRGADQGPLDVSDNLQFGFSEAVKAGSAGSIHLYRSTGAVVESFSTQANSRVIFDGQQVTVNPTWDFDGSNQYYLQIDAGSITSLGGEAFEGVSSTSVLGFTTDFENRNSPGSNFIRDEFPGTSSDLIGNHKALYIRATFTDMNRSPNTLFDAEEDMAEVTRGYMESSKGRMPMTLHYTPVVTLPYTFDWYWSFDYQVNGLGFLQTAARSEVEKLGFDTSLYDVVILRVDSGLRGGASWGGGDSAWVTWAGSSIMLHEVGHALGLGHANSIDLNGTATEYGNSLSWMGSDNGLEDQFDVRHQLGLGWLDADQVHRDRGPGTYRIHALDSTRQGDDLFYGLYQSVPGDWLSPSGSISYQLEYRPRAGEAAVGSALLYRNAYIMDLTPGSGGGQVDGGIRQGRTYRIPGSNSYFSVVDTGDDYLDVAYNQISPSDPANAQPSAMFTASATTVKRFDDVTFTASASDADADELLYYWEFSDGLYGSGQTFTRSFLQSAAQNITVKLIVSDMRGGEVTIEGQVAAGASATGTPGNFGSLTPPSGTTPKVSVTVADGFATEGKNDSGSLLVRRTGGSTSLPLAVQLSYSGAAAAGQFSSLPSSVTIPANSDSVLLNLSPTDDSVIESMKTVIVTIVADSAYQTIAQNSSAFVTLYDDDTPVVTISAIDAFSSEPAATGRDTGLFRIERSGPVNADLTVYYGLMGSAHNGFDYEQLDGQIIIPAGQTAVYLMINALDDGISEWDESVIVALTSFGGYSVGNQSQDTVWIRDNADLPSVSVRATRSWASEGETGHFTFYATPGSSPLTINYAISGTATSVTDYQALTGTVVIPGGTGLRSVQVNVPSIADGIVEDEENVVVTISPSAAYSFGLDTSAQIRIYDPYNFSSGDDLVYLSRHYSDKNLGAASESKPVFYYIHRDNHSGSSTEGQWPGSNAAALNVTFSLSGTATPGVDYTAEVYLPISSGGTNSATGTLQSSFTPAATNTVTIPASQVGVIVKLVPVVDGVFEGTETITMRLESAAAGAKRIPVGIAREVTVDFLDGDVSPILVGFETLTAVTSEKSALTGNILEIPVVLSQTSSVTVEVKYSTIAGSATGFGVDWTFLDPTAGDQSVSEGWLTFAPGETRKNVKVMIPKDRVPENLETFGIELETPLNASLNTATSKISVSIYDVIPDSSFLEERWSTPAVFNDQSWSTVLPTFQAYVSSLTSAQNIGSNYSRRISGLITAPATGAYNFYVAGDDKVRLFLSPDQHSAGKTQIASLTNWTDFQQWDKYTTQKSAAIQLVAGQKYYIEVQQNEVGGGDHVSVAWTGPGISEITPIALPAEKVPVNRYVRFVTDSQAVREGQQFDIQVMLDKPDMYDPVVVNVEVASGATAQQGSDFSLSTFTLTFAPGETMKPLTVTALSDGLNEGPENFVLRLVSATGARVIDSRQFSVNVADANAPNIEPGIGFAKFGDVSGALIAQMSASASTGRTIASWEIVAGNPVLEGSTAAAFAVDGLGRITVANAAAVPVGSYEISLTIRATDNLGAASLSYARIVLNGRNFIDERWDSKDVYYYKQWDRTPDITTYLDTFDVVRNVSNHYSRRVSTVLTPTATGDYSFWIAADDDAYVTIAPFDNPTNETRLAVSDTVSWQNWSQFDAQQSRPVSLAGGQRYLLRAYHVEWGGSDHLSVAWSGPGFSRKLVGTADTARAYGEDIVWSSPLNQSGLGSVQGFSIDAFAQTNSGVTSSIVSGAFTRDQTLGLSGTTVPSGKVLIFEGSSLVGITTSGATGIWSFTTPELSEGLHTFHAEFIDALGNVARSKPVSFTVRSRIEVGNTTLLSGAAGSLSLTSTIDKPISVVRQFASADQGLVVFEAIGSEQFVEQRWSGSAAYQNNSWDPATAVYTGSLASLTTAQNVADNYSRRITGLITAPMTGQYTFYISSDDGSRLYLSTDESVANKSLIASVADGNWTNFREWSKYTSQKSVSISLQAGQRYYVDIHHSEGGGDDHVSVAWTLPGSTAITPISIMSDIYVANSRTGVVQLVTRGLSSPTVSAGVATTFLDISQDGRHVLFGTSEVTSFGNGGTPFTGSSVLRSGPYTDIIAFDVTDASMKLVTSGPVAGTSASRQAQYVSTSDDGRYAIFTTDHVEKIGGFTAPVKLFWRLVEDGYASPAGRLKTTAIRVADLDLSDFSIQIAGSVPGQAATVRVDTIEQSAGQLTFWVQSTTGAKAVKMRLSDTANGIQVTALTAASADLTLSTGPANGQANVSPATGVPGTGQTFTTGNLQYGDRLRTISIAGPTSGAAGTSYTLKVWKNNGDVNTFAPGSLVATSNNSLALPDSQTAVFEFSGQQLDSNTVYLFSLSSTAGDHVNFRAGTTTTGLADARLLSTLSSSIDLAFRLTTSPADETLATIDWNNLSSPLELANTIAGSLSVATLSRVGGVGQTFTTGSIGTANRLTEISIQGPSSSPQNTVFTLKVWENNGDFNTFAPGTLVATSTNSSSLPQNSLVTFTFSGQQLQSNKVYVFSLTSSSGDHATFRSSVTNASGVRLENGRVFSGLDSAYDVAFRLRLATAELLNGGSSGNLPYAVTPQLVATTDGAAGLGVSRFSIGYPKASNAMLSEVSTDDLEPSTDVVAYELATGDRKLLSHSAAGQTVSGAAGVSQVSVSADGRYALFTAADATRLGNGGTAFTDPDMTVADWFAADLQTGQIRLLTRSAASPLSSLVSSMTLLGTSSDGYAVFSTTNATAWGYADSAPGTTNLLSINLADGTVRLISRSSGSNLNSTSGQSVTFQQISGQYLYFSAADATKLGFVSDGNTARADLFRYRLDNGALDLLSHTATSVVDAMNGTYESGSLTVSADGRYAAFALYLDSNYGGFTRNISGDALFLADTQANTIRLLNSTNTAGTNMSYAAWADLGNQVSNPRFFTPDSSRFVWLTSYTEFIAISGRSYASGVDKQYGLVALVTDLSGGVINAGSAQDNYVLSHSAAGKDQISSAVKLLGVSKDSRTAFFSSANATAFGNGGVAFTDPSTSSTDVFAVNLTTRDIELLSGANGASYGQAASLVGIADGGEAIISMASVGGIPVLAGNVTDNNGSGLDLISRRFSLIDLNSSDDTAAGGSDIDNITTKTSFGLNSLVTPGQRVQLLQDGLMIQEKVADASGRIHWQLSGVSGGVHTYSLWFPEELIPVRTSSALGNSALTITVIGSNNPPTDVALSGTSIAENAGTNAAVGTFSTTDPDFGQSFTYTLVTGNGDTNNSAFSITGSTLRANSGFDFESKSSYSIRVRSTDQDGLFTEKSFTITVTDLNEVPTNIALSSSSIAENAGADAPVGTLSTTDQDAGQTFTYTLVSGAGDSGNSAFNIAGNTLRATASFDFEIKSSYSIRVRSTDQGGLATDKIFTISVTNSNDAPTSIALSANSIPENAGINAVVGTLSTVDPDGDTAFSYELVGGAGDSGNAQFNISGDTLRANASFNHLVQGTWTVRVRSTDGGGLSAEQSFVITVTAPPAVTADPSAITVLTGATATFSAAATGNPAPAVQWQVSLDNGGSWSNISGANAATLSFTAQFNDHAKRYRAVFSNAHGTATSAAAQLTVNAAPTITTQPADAFANIGDTVVFTAAAQGRPEPSVQWQTSTDNGSTWSDISAATAASYSLTAARADNGRRLRVVFSNSVGTVTSNAAVLGVDVVAPTSRVTALAARQTAATFTVNVTGSDPIPSGGLHSYDVYVAVNSGAFSLHTTVIPNAQGAASFQFTGDQQTTYWFRSIGRDKSGNIETKASGGDTSTYIPDVTAPVTSATAINADAPLFQISWAGTDAGGSGLKKMRLWAKVDASPWAMVEEQTVTSGSGVFTYPAIVDGTQHTYRFYTIGVDGVPNTELAPASVDGDQRVDRTFNPPANIEVSDLILNRNDALTQRSFIRYADIYLNSSLTGSQTVNVQLRWMGLNGLYTGNVLTAVPFSGNVAGSSRLQVDFGTTGITKYASGPTGAKPADSSLAGNGWGDGYYRLLVTIEAGGSQLLSKELHFYRLLGDVTGDRKVDASDSTAVLTVRNDPTSIKSATAPTILNCDVNGTGSINATDSSVVSAARTRNTQLTTPPWTLDAVQLSPGVLRTGRSTALDPEVARRLAAVAIERWRKSGLGAADAARLLSLQVVVGDLPAPAIGLFGNDTVYIDYTADGAGWFIDATPFQDEEFESADPGGRAAAGSNAAAGSVDLMTVLFHEYGHAIGLEHHHAAIAGTSLMQETMLAGERKLPMAADLRAIGKMAIPNIPGRMIQLTESPAGAPSLVELDHCFEDLTQLDKPAPFSPDLPEALTSKKRKTPFWNVFSKDFSLFRQLFD